MKGCAVLNLKSLTIIAAENLSPGQVALLPAMGNEPVVVTSVGGKTTVVMLKAGGRPFDWFELRDVYGNALVIPGVEFEVDPRSHSENSPGFGALIRYGEQLLINATGPVGAFHIPIGDGYENVAHPKAYFARWRAIVREGEREFVIFEFDASASQ